MLVENYDVCIGGVHKIYFDKTTELRAKMIGVNFIINH